jgi:hypothetical protein
MKALREHIQQNNSFSELPENHQLRFEAKLRKALPQPFEMRSKILIFAAAMILLIISFVVVKQSSRNSSSYSDLILARETIDMIETEKYLRGQIELKISKFDSLGINNQLAFDFKLNLKELDESLEQLRKDLQVTPGDQRIVDAVINTYMLKIETIDNIMNILHKYS